MYEVINNMKIRTKLSVFVALIFSLIIAIAAILLYNIYFDEQNDMKLMEESIRSSYDSNIKNQVDNVITLLDGVYHRYQSGELTFEESKALGADLVRNLRYDKEGYFWIDTTEGVNVVLLGSSIEGSSRYDFCDAKGTPVIKQFLSMALQSGSGYQDYWYPRANQTEPIMKRGYVKLFKPFNWVVGTGNYIDDINQKINDQRQTSIIEFRNRIFTICLLFLGVVFCTAGLVSLMAKNITAPLQKTTHLANAISSGVLEETIDADLKKRKDEIGQLANSLEKMKISIKELVDTLTENATTLELEKELFGTTLKSIGDGVISTDKQGNIVLWNTVSEQLTGWKQEDAVGKPFEEVFQIIHEHTRERCANPVAKALQQKKIITLENHTVLVTKTGNEIPIEDSAAPITDKNGNIIGTVLVFRDVTEKKEKQKRIEYLSYHDQLTGLYNRHFFEEELKRLDVERNLPLTIAMADVNGLKLTNDAFGHEAGDLLLQSVAKVLKSVCRSDDIISRIGGDEFVILLPKTNSAQANLIVNRIHEAIGSQQINHIVMSISVGWETKTLPQQVLKEVLSKAEDHMYSTKITESQSMRNQTINVILQTLNKTNSSEKIHSERVSNLSRKIGESMKLDNEVLKELEIAGLMHDIGKIAIDSSLLNKHDNLSPEEMAEIKRHPEIGYHILKSADVYTKLAEYVLSHHERWDGKGYPRGLSHQEIPLVARIISVADAFETMTSDTTQKQPLSPQHAMEELKRLAGTQFDPKIVTAFEEITNPQNAGISD